MRRSGSGSSRIDVRLKSEERSLPTELSSTCCVDGQFVACHLDGSTVGTYRSADVCYLGFVEINRRKVEAGFARDCPAYSRGRYAASELAARDAGNDLSTSYDLPDYCEPAR